MLAATMRRWCLSLVVVSMLMAGGAPSTFGQSATSSPAEASVASSAAASGSSFSGTAAKQQVDALAGQIGSRPAGSAAFDQAVQYATSQLQQWGYQPRLETFPVQTYDDRGSQVQVTASGSGLQIAADTLTYSVGGDVEAPLVAAGLGQPDDLAMVDARGKIVLLKRGALRFSEKVSNAAAAGAVAAVVYNDSPGRVQGSLVQPEAIPAATIAAESGQQLLDLLAAGEVRVRLTVNGSTQQSTGTNVIAELPGNRTDGASVIFGAHLDSVSAGPGANDNGSGSAVVLELAHNLAQRDLSQRPFTVRFVLFGAEELGLYGSRDYVQSLPDAQRRTIVAMINLDMVGVGDAWRFGGTDDLVQRALGAATELGVRSLPLRGPLSSASDHASFLDAGIPAVFLYRVEDPNYHTAGDRPELVDPAALEQAGTIALRVLDSLSSP